MVGAALALDLSGLDYLRAIAERRIPPPPIAVLLGMGIVDIQPGRVRFSLEVGEHLYNPIGSVHGGVFCTLLDSAMGCAVHSTLDRGQAYTTLELKVNLVKALTVNTPSVVATGQVISAGRRVITASGQVTGPDGTLYAHATTTCIAFELLAERREPQWRLSRGSKPPRWRAPASPSPSPSSPGGERPAAQVMAHVLAEPAGLAAVEVRAGGGAGEQRSQRERAPAGPGGQPPAQQPGQR